MSAQAALDDPAVRRHLDDTVRIWLGAAASVDVPRLPDELARRLLRVEEYERAHRDQWGCWEYGQTESFHEGRLWFADVDRWAAAQRRELAARAALEPLWPDGRTFAACVSHDVDLVSTASTPAQALRSMRLSLTGAGALRLARPPVRLARAVRHGVSAAPAATPLELALDVEREHGVRGTYFFTVYPGAGGHRYDCTYDFGDPCRFRGRRVRIREVVETVAAEGHDVGLHGSYNSALTPGVLAREKAALEAAGGHPVTTTRQHFLHWDVRTTPRLQAEAGLRADSTLGFNRNLGFRAGTSLPFRHFDLERRERLDLLQLPLVVHEGPLLRADGLELDVELAKAVVRRLVDEIEGVGGVVTLLFHPNSLERPEFLELFQDALALCAERGAWFASMHQLDEWWRERETRLRG